jgi:hypothetical protein
MSQGYNAPTTSQGYLAKPSSAADPTAVTAAAVIADNTIVRGDGGARGIQASGWTIDDNDDLAVGARGDVFDLSGDGGEYLLSGANHQISMWANTLERLRINSGQLLVSTGLYVNGFVSGPNGNIRFGANWSVNPSLVHSDFNVDTFTIGLPKSSRSVVFVEAADTATDTGHAQQDNPTVFVHSADVTDLTQWVSLAHDQDDAVINWGTGLLDLAGASMGSGTVTHDDYFEIQIGGVTKKVMCGS